MHHPFFVLLLLSARAASEEQPPPLRNGVYSFRLIFIRHGLSCANVVSQACTAHAWKLTPDGLGRPVYDKMMNNMDELLRHREPQSMVGITRTFGIKPRNWEIPGNSNTANGKSKSCLIKVRNKSLIDNDFGTFGNLVEIGSLVKDPNIIACSEELAKETAARLASWLRNERVEFDLLGSSTLKRAVETTELVFKRNPQKAALRKVDAITLLPYINEKNPSAAFEAENFPYPADVQHRQMVELLGDSMSRLETGFTSGLGSYPRTDQNWDKFKAFLALDLLPRLVSQKDGVSTRWTPNPDVVAALEAGRSEGRPRIVEQSNWPQVRDEPLLELTAGPHQYVWEEPVVPSELESNVTAGSTNEFVLGIGSHSGFLRSYCLEMQFLPNNFAVLEKRIQVRVTTSAEGRTTFHVAETSGPCRMILDGAPHPVPGSLTKSDLGSNCNFPINVGLLVDMQTGGASGCSSQRTVI
eukprot:TRINITY_DN5450_c0_g1_i10.p1 TRINITY_DN5450_c0_g1~~TRINITY_DN5450_c0_g1_i10.p1  ORF type:complete len:469 (+),score=49.31 TRINITY_DN5450_c0_g1_i10:32-1438(+)